jgi:hypothetical protein
VEKKMRKIFLMVLTFVAMSIYAQTPISSNRIPGSSIVLNNLSGSNVQKILHGTIFDVFDLDFKSNEYNTELKKITFWETSEGQNYQKRLDGLENRLRNQGIKTIPLAKRYTTKDYITTISNYDVEKRGFNIIIGCNDWEFGPTSFESPGPYTNDIRGFRIPNITVPYFMSVSMDIAQRIEGNEKAVVQLQLEVDTFAIKKIFIINIDTLEIYAEEYYAVPANGPFTSPPTRRNLFTPITPNPLPNYRR